VLFCCLLFAPLSFAQSGPEAHSNDGQSNFDRAFYDIYMHVASTDVNVALRAADSLYRVSTTDIQQVRALMLIGEMHRRVANRDSSIYYAERAIRIANNAKLYEWQARIYGALSTQLREMGLLNKGAHYLALGLKAIEHIDNEHVVWQYKGLSLQESGHYALEKQDFSGALADFQQAEVFLKKLSESPSTLFMLAQNHERLGLCYLELGRLDSSRIHYERALELEPSPGTAESPVKGLIYTGLGLLDIKDNQDSNAYAYLQKALHIAETTEFPSLKIDVYEALAAYYRKAGDLEAYTKYNDLFLATQNQYNQRNKGYVDEVFTGVEANFAKVSASNRLLLVFSACCLVVCGLGFLFFLRRQRKQRRRFKEIIANLRNNRVYAVNVDPVENIDLVVDDGGEEPVADHPREVVSESTRTELMDKLTQFEASHGFIEKGISIAVLAGKLNTNTKYLSHVINQYKGKDFNTYINELRINYIISKMESDARYLNYKISYLAEESGFSSHSQFATVFRGIAGMSPSTFIAYLRKEEKDVDERSLVS